jgi:hypothetical protein
VPALPDASAAATLRPHMVSRAFNVLALVALLVLLAAYMGTVR